MQTITVNGGTLFGLAGQYLNDASQWIRIAQQNGLSDPVLVNNTAANAGVISTISGVPFFTLTIPDVDANATGGIANT